MNTPLRYGGETFFQARMVRIGKALHDRLAGGPQSGLLPYCSCICVALGMLIHFGIHLIGFVNRRVA